MPLAYGVANDETNTRPDRTFRHYFQRLFPDIVRLSTFKDMQSTNKKWITSPEEVRRTKSSRQSVDSVKNRGRIRTDNRARWFFALKDDDIFVHIFGKGKESKAYTFSGDEEPRKVMDVLPSKSQSDTLKVNNSL